jgi:hypothetical protein
MLWARAHKNCRIGMTRIVLRMLIDLHALRVVRCPF